MKFSMLNSQISWIKFHRELHTLQLIIKIING